MARLERATRDVAPRHAATGHPLSVLTAGDARGSVATATIPRLARYAQALAGPILIIHMQCISQHRIFALSFARLLCVSASGDGTMARWSLANNHQPCHTVLFVTFAPLTSLLVALLDAVFRCAPLKNHPPPCPSRGPSVGSQHALDEIPSMMRSHFLA